VSAVVTKKENLWFRLIHEHYVKVGKTGELVQE